MSEIQSIHILPESLANKIAAGEVIDRPASVIKELIENAIDAKATQITIHIENAGLTMMRVVDNGIGMTRKDLRMSINRHATSKILTDKDLYNIKTLGFRGEAMASIAAVSRMDIKSRIQSDTEGHSIEVESGIIRADHIRSGASGTSVSVYDLFFNTPARKEFLKSAAAENMSINDTVTRFSLGHPNIAFLLVSDGKRVLQTSGSGQRQDVIGTIYGTEIARKMISVSASKIPDRLQIQGEIAPPTVTRASRKHISTFVNGRWVKNKLFDDAVMAAYETYLPVHRFPVCVLELHIPAKRIDVNVHPAKLEIRFHHEDTVFQFIRDTVKAHLAIGLQTPGVYIPGKAGYERPSQEILQFESHTAEQKDRYSSRQRIDIPAPNASEREAECSVVPLPSETEVQTIKNQNQRTDDISSNTSFRVIGQIFTTYILIEKNDEMLIIDQHAAQERTMYEKMIQNTNLGISAQQLLVPKSVDLTPSEIIAAKDQEEGLHEVGFEFDYASGNTVFLRAIPSDMPMGIAEELFRTVLADADISERMPHQTERREQIIRAACRASIKANDYMTKEEMNALIRQLFKAKNPYTCPHGRPTMLRFTKSEFEKMFKRIQ